jgi:hypothetical protein
VPVCAAIIFLRSPMVSSGEHLTRTAARCEPRRRGQRAATRTLAPETVVADDFDEARHGGRGWSGGRRQAAEGVVVVVRRAAAPAPRGRGPCCALQRRKPCPATRANILRLPAPRISHAGRARAPRRVRRSATTSERRHEAKLLLTACLLPFSLRSPCARRTAAGACRCSAGCEAMAVWLAWWLLLAR